MKPSRAQQGHLLGTVAQALPEPIKGARVIICQRGRKASPTPEDLAQLQAFADMLAGRALDQQEGAR